MRKYILSIILICIGGALMAQDVHFTQFYSTPIFVNPAFAGTREHSRAAGIARQQWSATNANYLTTAVSYDRNLDHYNSGVGILISVDRAGSAGLNNSLFGLIYSYKIKPKSQKWTIQTGLNFSFGTVSLNTSKLILGDQLSLDGNISPTNDLNAFARRGYFDFSSGALMYGKGYWFGISGKHLNKPNQSLLDNSSEVPILVSLHGGLNINLVRDFRNKNEIYILPAFQYKTQGKYDQLDLGAYLMYNKLMGGLWYRGLPIKRYALGFPNSDAVALMLGYKIDDQLRFGYSYDITVSNLASNSAGAHEISMSYEFSYKHHRKKPKRKDMKIECPFPMM